MLNLVCSYALSYILGHLFSGAVFKWTQTSCAERHEVDVTCPKFSLIRFFSLFGSENTIRSSDIYSVTSILFIHFSFCQVHVKKPKENTARVNLQIKIRINRRSDERDCMHLQKVTATGNVDLLGFFLLFYALSVSCLSVLWTIGPFICLIIYQ